MCLEAEWTLDVESEVGWVVGLSVVLCAVPTGQPWAGWSRWLESRHQSRLETQSGVIGVDVIFKAMSLPELTKE